MPDGSQTAPSLFTDAGKIRNDIREIVPEADVSYSRGRLSITVPSEVQDEFAKQTAEMIRTIFTALDWNRAYIESVEFCMKDRSNPDQTLRVEINKESHKTYSDDDNAEKYERKISDVSVSADKEMKKYTTTTETLLLNPEYLGPYMAE